MMRLLSDALGAIYEVQLPLLTPQLPGRIRLDQGLPKWIHIPQIPSLWVCEVKAALVTLQRHYVPFPLFLTFESEMGQ